MARTRAPVSGGARTPRATGAATPAFPPVCDADDMPEFGLVQGAVTSRPQPHWRVRLYGLTADPHARYVFGVLALAALYRGVAQIGYEVQFAGPVAAIAWLPVGVGIAFLYLGGLRYWPGVLIGDLLANDYGALPLGSALGQTTGNVLEVLVATLLLRCGACADEREVTVGDDVAKRYGEDLDASQREIERAVERLDRERMAGETEIFAQALERDLIDAGDFARGVGC